MNIANTGSFARDEHSATHAAIVITGAGPTGLVLAALQIVISGPQIFIDSFGTVFSLAGSGQPSRIALNTSILGFTSQLFATDPRVTPLLEIGRAHV